MNERFGRGPALAPILVLGGCTTAAVPTYGPGLLVMVVLTTVTVVVGRRWQARARTPEAVTAGVFIVLVVTLAVSATLTGGAHSPLLPLAVIPVFTQAIFFRPRVTAVWTVLVGVLVTAGVAVAHVLPPVPRAPDALPVLVLLALLICVCVAAQHLAASDASARSTAAHDPLTGLPNRRALAEHFAQVREHARVHGAGLGDQAGEVALMVVDVDHFKQVNDTYGHQRGDRVLVGVAGLLSAAVRAGDSVHRVGGEEFVVLAPGTGRVECAVAAERLRRSVREARTDGLEVTVSIGTCVASARTADLATLHRSADRALYEAKRAGRDRVVSADGDPGHRRDGSRPLTAGPG